MKKHVLVICFMVLCLYISIPVSAAQYSFHYSSAAVKAGSVSNVYIIREIVNRIRINLNGAALMIK